jgi:hypothetical protein
MEETATQPSVNANNLFTTRLFSCVLIVDSVNNFEVFPLLRSLSIVVLAFVLS